MNHIGTHDRLEKIILSTVLQCCLDVGKILETAYEDDGSPDILLSYRSQDIYAAQSWHRDIKQRDIRPERDDSLQSALAIVVFPYDLYAKALPV